MDLILWMELTYEVSVGQKKSLQNEQLWFKNTKLRFSKTRSFGVKNPKFWFEKLEVSLRKPEVLVRKPKVSVRKPEVSGKIFEFETSVKVVFRNASVAETRNFKLLCNLGLSLLISIKKFFLSESHNLGFNLQISSSFQVQK
jgi:hypothetical protein